jgi:hypothetical protein
VLISEVSTISSERWIEEVSAATGASSFFFDLADFSVAGGSEMFFFIGFEWPMAGFLFV